MQALRAALSGLEMASTPQDKHRRLLEADERLTELEQLLEQKDCMIDQLRREQAIMQQHTAELHSQITVFKSEREEWKAVVERLNGELERFKEQCEQQVRRREAAEAQLPGDGKRIGSGGGSGGGAASMVAEKGAAIVLGGLESIAVGKSIAGKLFSVGAGTDRSKPGQDSIYAESFAGAGVGELQGAATGARTAPGARDQYAKEPNAFGLDGVSGAGSTDVVGRGGGACAGRDVARSSEGGRRIRVCVCVF